jgi:hypothetical protein
MPDQSEEARRVHAAVTAHWRAVVESAARREESLRTELEQLRAQRRAVLDLSAGFIDDIRTALGDTP